MRATFVKIYLDNLRHNLGVIRNRINKNTMMCVAVKADAYGHGAVECARTAVECGADFLAVACISEGVELRNAGITTPVLVLSLCQPEEMEEAVKNDLTPLVFDEQYINHLAVAANKLGKKNYKVHIAVDTGMGRIGCLPENAGKIALAVKNTGVLETGGICTHFSCADSVDENDAAYTKQQFELFLRAIENVKAEGIDPGIRHCSNSALTLDHPEMHLDMCRPGIIVYGYYPGDLNADYFKKKGESIELKPVMALVSKVVAIRDFDENKAVSYGRTWSTTKKTKIAILPVGYGDGLLRRFNQTENGLKVSIKGKSYCVRGRICMDQCMVDIGTDSDVSLYDEAVIFGPEESGALQSAQEIADATGTISYEITCGVTKSRVLRVFC